MKFVSAVKRDWGWNAVRCWPTSGAGTLSSPASTLVVQSGTATTYLLLVETVCSFSHRAANMCVIFWTVDDPHYHLVIASNRDEFLSRPTLPASWHDFASSSSSSSSSSASASNNGADQPQILSARDPAGGGTWLGVTRNGAFATLTNFTELSAPLPQGMAAFESRGQLVKDWLVSQSQSQHTNRDGQDNGRGVEETTREIEAYMAKVRAKLDRFPGFNLLVGAVSTQGTVVGYITNRTIDGKLDSDRQADIFPPRPTVSRPTPDADEKAAAAVANTENTPVYTHALASQHELPGGMSNSVLTQPWAKVTSGSLAFTSTLAHSRLLLPDRNAAEATLVEELFDVLWTCSDPVPAQRSELRNSVLIPPLEMPHANDWYATRTSTVILLGRDGRSKFVERDTFNLVGAKPVWINGPAGRGAINGRCTGERVFEWHLAT